jgi:hypothetical protein
MNKLESRIAKLEEAGRKAAECTVVRVVAYCCTGDGNGGLAQGELIGFHAKAGDKESTVEREPGESEDDLLKRATKGLTGLILVHEIRKGESYVKPVPTVAAVAEPQEPKPEPVAPRVIPRPAPREEIIILGSVERQHGIGSPWGFMA